MAWLAKSSNSIKNFWKNFKSATEEVRFIVVNGFILGLIILLSYSIIKEINSDNIVFNPTDVPQSLIDKGYNGTVVARSIVDEINLIKLIAEDSLNIKLLPTEKAISIIVPNNSPELNFEIPKTGIYFLNIVNFFKRYLNKQTTSINSEITVRDKKFFLKLRYKNLVISSFNSLDSTGKGIRSVALDLLKELQPLTASYYLLKRKRYAEYDYLLKKNSYRFTDEQLSKSKFLLGFISVINKRYKKADILLDLLQRCKFAL